MDANHRIHQARPPEQANTEPNHQEVVRTLYVQTANWKRLKNEVENFGQNYSANSAPILQTTVKRKN